MPTWALAAIALSVALVLAAAIVTALAALPLLRSAGAVGRLLEPAFAELGRSTDELAGHAERAAEAGVRLEGAVAGLNVSLARLRVLGWALGDVRALLDLLRAAVPRR